MALRIHHLRPAPDANTTETRMGRGEASEGETADRDTKGTGAHKDVPAGFESGQMPMHMRIPKLKGFKNPFRVEYQVVDVGCLTKLFSRGGVITVEDLVGAGAVRSSALVEVLDDGDINVALNVTIDTFSDSAREKLAAAGDSAVKA